METHDGQEIKDQVHIVLRGPDGKVKDERDIKEESEDGTDS